MSQRLITARLPIWLVEQIAEAGRTSAHLGDVMARSTRCGHSSSRKGDGARHWNLSSWAPHAAGSPGFQEIVRSTAIAWPRTTA